MAKATPESLVYSGQEGTGVARIFGQEGNPYRPLIRSAARKQQEQAIQAAAAAKAKEDRDKKMFELLNVDPEKTFQPFNEQVRSAADRQNKKVIEYFNKGGDPDNLNFRMMNQKGWDDVNDIARKGNYIKEKITEVRDLVKEDPYMNARYYNDRLNDVYMDEYGNGKPIDEIDVSNLSDIMDDPGGFDRKKYATDFMKDVKTNVINVIKQRAIDEGLETRDIKIDAADFYEIDPNAIDGIARNEDGTPIVKVTPEFKQAFFSNEYAKRAFQADADRMGVPVEDVIKDWIVSQGPKPKKDENVSISRESQWQSNLEAMMANGGIHPKDVPFYTNRWNNINNLVNAVQDGDVTPEARAALGHLKKNMKVGGGDVMDAVIIPGNNTPGVSQFMDMSIKNSPNDRIVFKVKRGTRGRGEPVEIDLSSEGAGAEINSLFQTAKTEGDLNIGWDQLLKMNNAKSSDIYRNRVNQTAKNEDEKQQENKTVASWQKGEDLGQLEGRTYGGDRIVEAKRVKVEPTGLLGMGTGKWGIELTIDTGDKTNPVRYETISEEDYEGLAKIYRGETAELPVVSDQAGYDKLPKGAQYKGPDGKTYKKK